MKSKILLFVLASSLLLTSCGINIPSENKSSDNSSSSTDTDESSSSSSSHTSKYQEYEDREWYSVGLEAYTDSSGNNAYFEALINYESFEKGKYTCDDDFYGHFNLYICENGDVLLDQLTKMEAFDKSEYQFTKLNVSDCSYINSCIGMEKKNAMFSYYLELSAIFFGIVKEKLTFTDKTFSGIGDVYSFCGVVPLIYNMGTVSKNDTASYVCSQAYGVGPSFDNTYLFTRYMNCNSTFTYVGLPPFLSSFNVINWDYIRKYKEIRTYRVWCDSKLSLTFNGYTAEDVRGWIPLFYLGGYEEVSLRDELDSESPYLDFEATINIFGYSTSSGSSSKYLKNKIKLSYMPTKYDKDYNPIEYSITYTIEFASPVVIDGYGTLVFHDKGLYFYYTKEGAQTEAPIVGRDGTLITEYIKINDKKAISFFFPHKV